MLDLMYAKSTDNSPELKCGTVTYSLRETATGHLAFGNKSNFYFMRKKHPFYA